MTELICTEPGIGIELGTTFQVLSENGSEWEILLGNEYRRRSTNAAGALQVGKHLQNLSAKTSKK